MISVNYALAIFLIVKNSYCDLLFKYVFDAVFEFKTIPSDTAELYSFM